VEVELLNGSLTEASCVPWNCLGIP